ncbi:hypothetical protein [Neomoorella mulderi]|uniref:Quinate 5-dehydrogenase n=1 Tax=Moorella mulderi DSM 14980 TaxID=1122241 RepID=A0A151ATF6_9FIRM|nr:hypothetical protein [Moorella mulderi]KYH30901.1 hypothetical protein MOMUL_27750 [Moorella mulderi DSM 14980]
MGTNSRDYQVKLNCGQETILLERRGCNGRLDLAARLLKKLDGRVDALGLGGANFNYHLGSRCYPCPAGRYLARQVKETPLVDGSGWKQWVEPRAIDQLAFLPPGSRALVVSVLDRFWLARALQAAGYPVLAGDAAFGLKLPLGFPLSTFMILGYLTMPLLAHLPLGYLYPLGHDQEKSYPHYHHLFARVKIIAGDWHFIRRHLPVSLAGKVVITGGTTPGDRELLRRRGAAWLLATTPVFEGFSPAANAMEAMLVALGAAAPQYPALAGKLGWLPSLYCLQK